jgi:hypothetical protein
MPRSKPTNPTPAIALEYNLAPGGDALNVATAVDHARFIVAPTCPDQCLFALFSVLVHGGGFPWFEDLYTFAGFMFTDPDVCRIYLHVTGTDLTYGVDLPLTGPDGRPAGGFANLPQELAPLVRNGALANRTVLDDTDDYCTAVIDLSTFLGPTSARRRRRTGLSGGG